MTAWEKQIVNARGEPYHRPIFLCSVAEKKEAGIIEAEGRVIHIGKAEAIPIETVASVCLNVLDHFVPENGNKEQRETAHRGLYIAGKIVERLELSQAFLDSVKIALDSATIKLENDKNQGKSPTGFYPYWVIERVKQELGISDFKDA